MSRRIALALAAVMAVIALLAALFMEFPGLTSRDRPVAAPLRIDISAIRAGTFVERARRSSRVFVLRDFADQLHVFTVPFSDGAYWLPEFDWQHPGVPCADFGPDSKDGALVEGGGFRCRLPDHGEFFRYEHSWAYDGRNLGYRTADMKIAQYDIDRDVIILPQ